jgi:hypothetical protein
MTSRQCWRGAKGRLQEFGKEQELVLYGLVTALKACYAHAEIIPVTRRLIEISPPTERAGTCYSLAASLFGLCRLGEAEQAAQEGLGSVQDRGMRSSLLVLLAAIKRDQGKLQEALEYARQGSAEVTSAMEQYGDK